MGTFSTQLKSGKIASMDIYAIRKKNLLTLIGSRRKGVCAAKWEMAPAHLSQILSDRTEKNLGDDVARRVEAIENLPHGWMDQTHNSEDLKPIAVASADSKEAAAAKVLEMLQKHGKGLTGTAQKRIAEAVADSLSEGELRGNVVPVNFSRAPKLVDGDILIPQYDLRASMGHGQVPADYVEFMRNVVVSGVQLEKLGLDFTSPANLSIITGWGESMAPTIKSKDPVIVDRGITEFMGDGVYVITWDDMLYIKRLQNAGDGKLDLISDNPKHKARVVNADEVTVHARVLLVWNAQKL